jgi:hypothetical protein
MSTKTTRKPTRPAAKTARRSPAKRPTPKAARKPSRTAKVQGSKQSQLIEILRKPGGATIDQLTELTGWQPHTVRGAISGTLRKALKLNVTCVAHVYRIVEGQA